MPDLKLDPVTGDLYLGPNLDLALTDDASGETTAQLIKIALRTFLGEWFLDTRRGWDLKGLVFVKNPDLAAIEAAARDAILSVPTVAGIVSYTQSFDRANRRLTVSGVVQEASGATSAFEVTA